jgi:hypothetical protein
LVSRAARVSIIATVASVALFASSFFGRSSADAMSVWCAGDPTILVNGNPVSVTVHVPADRLRDLDYVEVVFHVPANSNVTLLLNDSLLLPVKTRYVKDQPAQYGLFGTKMPVEIISHNRGGTMPIGATSIALLKGTNLWVEGNSNAPLWINTTSLLNLRLF